MPGDLFIKERLPDGTFGELIPAFPDGLTTEQKLAQREEQLLQLEERMDQAIMELTMIIAMGGMP